MPTQPPRPISNFRRPIPPAPVESYDLPHPAVPPGLAGLTILHISDQHVTRPQIGRKRFRRILDALKATPVDLIALTGDSMTSPGDEPYAIDALARLAETWTARLGAFGIFGNHDSAEFIRQARDIPGITWLENRAVDLPGLRLIGASHPEDLLTAILPPPDPDASGPVGVSSLKPQASREPHRSRSGLFPNAECRLPNPAAHPVAGTSGSVGVSSLKAQASKEPRRSRSGLFPNADCRLPNPVAHPVAHLTSHPVACAPGFVSPQDSRLLLCLAHMPTEVYGAADLGVPIMLAGHTHGGQFRVSPRLAPHTSSDLPPHLASGMIRLRGTLCCISRGIGDALVELRVNCPPQMPLYTLRRAPLPSTPDESVPVQVVAW